MKIKPISGQHVLAPGTACARCDGTIRLLGVVFYENAEERTVCRSCYEKSKAAPAPTEGNQAWR